MNQRLRRPPPDVVYTPIDVTSFSFTASDSALSDTATISITVTPVNDAPIAADDSYNVSPDNTLAVATASGVIANDFDTEEDGLSAVLISRPSNGVLTFSADGSFIYTPNAGFNGLDVFSYKANDGTADSYFDAIVRISVNPVIDAPVANDQGVTTPEDTPVTITLGSSPLSFDVATQPGHGTLSGTAPNLIYTPAAGYYGSDSFSFTASDGALSDTATISITITPR